MHGYRCRGLWECAGQACTAIAAVEHVIARPYDKLRIGTLFADIPMALRRVVAKFDKDMTKHPMGDLEKYSSS